MPALITQSFLQVLSWLRKRYACDGFMDSENIPFSVVLTDFREINDYGKIGIGSTLSEMNCTAS